MTDAHWAAICRPIFDKNTFSWNCNERCTMAFATENESGLSLHGEGAARRQAITELLFFASVGDVERCQKLVDIWGLVVTDSNCCDYDRRTPLHLAASEGCHSVIEWLLKKHQVNPNPIDRFKRTPLEDAVRGDHKEVANLLIECGAQVLDKDGNLVELSDSHLSMNLRLMCEVGEDWEINPKDLKFIEQIGEGEFGVVHKARWHGTIVAVKVLKSSSQVAIGDFKTELNVLQKSHHPHTVQFLGAVTRAPPFMIVTEFMHGGSLDDVFRSRQTFTIRRALEVALDTARGMAYLHNRNPNSVCIIHRDLKPANLMLGGHKVKTREHKRLMVNDTGIVKIADFGLSKSIKTRLYRRHAQRELGTLKLMGQGSVEDKDDLWVDPVDHKSFSYQLTGETGSYRYMAPEVFRHETYNEKVDVYAFAMLFFLLLVGVPPFFDMDPVSAARSAAMDGRRPDWLPTNRHGEKIPEAARKLVEDCWAGDFDHRPDFKSLVDGLEALIDDYDVQNGGKKSKGCCVVQ